MTKHEQNYVECCRKDWMHLRRMAKIPGKGQEGDKRECEKARVRLLKAIREAQ